MATAQTVLDQIAETFDDVDPTKVLLYLNRAHEWILSQIQLKTSTETFSSLVKDTTEYALTATVAKIWSARYVKSSADDDFTVMLPTSIEERDHLDPNWRL